MNPVIKENITAVNFDDGRFGQKIEGIVMHSCWGTYVGSIQWFKNPKAFCSSHYVIRKDGEITRCVLDKNTAWHAGNTEQEKMYLKNTGIAPQMVKDKWDTNINFYTVGVEMEDERKKDWKYPANQYTAAVYLAADLCHRYDIPLDRGHIVQHKETNPLNRTDPVGSWNHDKFICDVSKVVLYQYKDLKEYRYIGNIHIRSDVAEANIRLDPCVTENVDGHLLSTQPFEVISFVEGEEITCEINGVPETSNIWWKTKEKKFVWSKLTVELPVEQKEDEMVENAFVATVHVRAGLTGLSLRGDPALEAPKTGKVKDTLNVVAWVVADDVGGENRWWKTDKGEFASVAGTQEKPDATGEYKMTEAEKAELVADIRLQIEVLNGRLAEVLEVPVDGIPTPQEEPVLPESLVAKIEAILELVAKAFNIKLKTA
jgi:N-acetyl-anhydromuramyl-L-alanine amidase AmpD